VKNTCLQAIFETAYDAMLVLDGSQTILMANPAAARMYRCAIADLVGSSMRQWTPKGLWPQHQTDAQTPVDANARGVPCAHPEEHAGLRADGQEFPVELTHSHVTFEGQVLHLLTLRDMTVSLQSLRGIVGSRAKLAAALASMGDGVAIVDLDGTYIEMNASFAAFHRFASTPESKRAAVDCAAIFDLHTLAGDWVPVDHWPVYQALRGEVASAAEYRLHCKKTAQSWFGSYSFAPVRDEHGTIIGAVTTVRDVTAAKQMQAALESSRAELRRLVAGQQLAEENERKRIARELHDDLQQTLAALRLSVAAIDRQAQIDPAEVSARVASALTLAESAIQSTRRMVSGLRPQILDDFGLQEALASLLASFGDRTGIEWDLDVREGGDAELPSAIATGLFRVAQESLHNIEKHARASFVQVTLEVPAAHQVVLQLHDDGVGIRSNDLLKRQSFGVLGMEERLRAMGGTLRLTPGAESGTTLEAVVPLA
jgi:PAS domain S-box-containing protein